MGLFDAAFEDDFDDDAIAAIGVITTDRVPAGTYLATVSRFKVNSKEALPDKEATRGYTIEFTIDEDSENSPNRKLWEYLGIPMNLRDMDEKDQKKIGRLKGRWVSLGLPANNILKSDEEDLIGIEVMITVRYNKGKDDQEFTNYEVKLRKPAGSSGVLASSAGVVRQASPLAASMAARAAAKPVTADTDDFL